MSINLRPLRIGILAIGFWSSALGLSSQAATLYTDLASFLDNIQAGEYLNDFNTLTAGDQGVTSQSFSGSGFSYTITPTVASGTANNTWVAPVTGGDKAMSTRFSMRGLRIDFTSGNITAVGGNFFLLGSNGTSPIAGNLSINLSDGSSANFSSQANNNYPFEGFAAADGTLITSLDLSYAPSNRFVAVDNLRVGRSKRIPEPSNIVGMLLFCMALFRIRNLRKNTLSC
jgi:hypothetical protein